VKKQGDEYKAYVFSFRLASDGKSMTGRWSLDGHDLPFDLKPGGLPAEPHNRRRGASHNRPGLSKPEARSGRRLP
jgi:hypothetical protein